MLASGRGGDEEEDDYMGDLGRFLGPQDMPQPKAAPVESKRGKGKASWKGKREVKEKKKKDAEEENLAEGLKAAIPASNIGFKLMQQMGYKAGGALGKHGQGSLEPISLELKRSRTGLGRDDVVRQQKVLEAKVAALEAYSQQRKEEQLKHDFHDRRKETWQKRKIMSDYRKACATLTQLEDTRKNAGMEGKEFSLELVECKKEEPVADEEEVEEEEEVSQEQLQELLERLRSEFLYCLYCGCQYDSVEFLLRDCPGVEDDVH